MLWYVLELVLAGPAERTLQAALLSLGCACEGNGELFRRSPHSQDMYIRTYIFVGGSEKTYHMVG